MSWFSNYFHTTTGNKISDVIPTFSRGEGQSIFDVGVKVSPSEETQKIIEDTTGALQQYQGVILIGIVIFGAYLLQKRGF